MQCCHQLYNTGFIHQAGLRRYRLKSIELFDYKSFFRYHFTFLTLGYLFDNVFIDK